MTPIDWVKVAKGQLPDESRIARGEAGTCPTCGMCIGVRIPKGGDGSLRVMVRHMWKRDRVFGVCAGVGAAAEEWGA